MLVKSIKSSRRFVDNTMKHLQKLNSIPNKKSKLTPAGVKKLFSGWILVVPTIILFIFLVWRPIVIGVMYSFYDLRGTTPTDFVAFKNYVDVLTDSNFLSTLLNTVKYVLWSLLIGLPLPFIAAVIMNEKRHFKGFYKFTLYLPVVMPAIVTCLIWRFIYGEGSGGLLNMIIMGLGGNPMAWLSDKTMTIPLIIVAMTWNSFGNTMILYLSSLQGVDVSLYEAARIEGAGFWRRLWVVVMPHMRGIMLLLGIKQIIGVFQITEQPLVMTGGGPNGASMSIGLTNYFYAFRYGQMDKSLALGVITFLLLLSLTFVYFKLDKKIND